MRRGLTADVLIVGAGPAGSALAAMLAEEGVDVLVVDRARFPREKACGECVNPGGVAALERLGLIESVLSTHPVELEGWNLCPPEGSPVEARFPSGTGHALGVRRGPFDAALIRNAVARGARFQDGVHVQTLDGSGPYPALGGRTVGGPPSGGPSTAGSWRARARLVVGADGLQSVTARAIDAPKSGPRRVKASLSWHLEGPVPHAMVGSLLLGGPFTSGLAPVCTVDTESRHRAIWSQTLVVDPERFGSELRADPESARTRALERLRPWDADQFRPLEGPRGSGPFDRPVRRVVRGPVLLVGDAAGYFDPLTGQGIHRALRSAELAAPVLLDALKDHPVQPGSLAPYEQALRRAFTPGRRLQWLIDRTLERPILRASAFGLLRHVPRLADTLVGVTGDALPARSLLLGRGTSAGPPPFDSVRGCL